MGAIVLALALIGLLILFSYLKFPPPYADKKTVRVFDLMVLGVCAVLCFGYFMKTRVTMVGTPDEMWWQPMAIIGAIGIEIVFLSIGFVLRNFWIFKPPRRPGDGRFGF